MVFVVLVVVIVAVVVKVAVVVVSGCRSRDSRKAGCGFGSIKLDWFLSLDRLVGLVVKASASRAGGPGFESR